MSSYLSKERLKYYFSPWNGNTAIWRNCNFRLNSIHNIAASTAEIMSQPVFCAFCVFRRRIPFTGGFMMWGIINQTINQYSTKHICGQSCVKRSSIAPAQNSLTGFGCALRWRNFDNWPYQGRRWLSRMNKLVTCNIALCLNVGGGEISRKEINWNYGHNGSLLSDNMYLYYVSWCSECTWGTS